ncbi:MAG: class II aldolase/adducin family protein [Phycisphaerae bacterium]|nr:class II aldolase/adducin family protein [Phycisphaerae bacterium]
MANESGIRREICEIGRRLYAKGFAAGNDGNISYRLNENTVVCTPTQICKGFMREDDLCVVDYDGWQKAGSQNRTSEILLHLEIYKADPSIMSVVHCHPPHATAFGVARVDIPTCILPEVEIFLGIMPRAEYETPGGQSFAETVRPFIGKANTVVLSNHGTVSWGDSVEQAYWKTEIVDAYCRILLLAAQLGNIERLPLPKQMELLELKKRFGVGEDTRITHGGEMYVNPDFGTSASIASQHEALAQGIADRVAEILKQRGQQK